MQSIECHAMGLTHVSLWGDARLATKSPSLRGEVRGVGGKLEEGGCCGYFARAVSYCARKNKTKHTTAQETRNCTGSATVFFAFEGVVWSHFACVQTSPISHVVTEKFNALQTLYRHFKFYIIPIRNRIEGIFSISGNIRNLLCRTLRAINTWVQ